MVYCHPLMQLVTPSRPIVVIFMAPVPHHHGRPHVFMCLMSEFLTAFSYCAKSKQQSGSTPKNWQQCQIHGLDSAILDIHGLESHSKLQALSSAIPDHECQIHGLEPHSKLQHQQHDQNARGPPADFKSALESIKNCQHGKRCNTSNTKRCACRAGRVWCFTVSQLWSLSMR
jgi:hypothetical protein